MPKLTAAEMHEFLQERGHLARLATIKADGSYILCSLRPALKRRAHLAKPGKPGSQGISVPLVHSVRSFSSG